MLLSPFNAGRYIDVGDRSSVNLDTQMFEMSVAGGGDRDSRPESIILGFSEFATLSEAGSVRASVASNFSEDEF